MHKITDEQEENGKAEKAEIIPRLSEQKHLENMGYDDGRKRRRTCPNMKKYKTTSRFYNTDPDGNPCDSDGFDDGQTHSDNIKKVVSPYVFCFRYFS
ncbi:hypothetical protein GCK72_017909 [Caenorhabditis remanei]|uniref:Uncharacterized protein n=1 Tax=Caenorhabditis remanei TaxID=31234 RepID=A0A6A5G9Q7_CAERE|nr:hypothetical protein GCK72_017909 [Caenorhabditis remanei]KAF1751355.1 hypothetical protein GCK72_017909 [Caenorhabditis remanei]